MRSFRGWEADALAVGAVAVVRVVEVVERPAVGRDVGRAFVGRVVGFAGAGRLVAAPRLMGAVRPIFALYCFPSLPRSRMAHAL